MKKTKFSDKHKLILITVSEILTVVWSISGMMVNYCRRGKYVLSGIHSSGYTISPVLAYFLSAVLILYLLRKYEKNIKK